VAFPLASTLLTLLTFTMLMAIHTASFPLYAAAYAAMGLMEATTALQSGALSLMYGGPKLPLVLTAVFILNAAGETVCFGLAAFGVSLPTTVSILLGVQCASMACAWWSGWRLREIAAAAAAEGGGSLMHFPAIGVDASELESAAEETPHSPGRPRKGSKLRRRTHHLGHSTPSSPVASDGNATASCGSDAEDSAADSVTSNVTSTTLPLSQAFVSSFMPPMLVVPPPPLDSLTTDSPPSLRRDASPVFFIIVFLVFTFFGGTALTYAVFAVDMYQSQYGITKEAAASYSSIGLLLLPVVAIASSALNGRFGLRGVSLIFWTSVFTTVIMVASAGGLVPVALAVLASSAKAGFHSTLVTTIPLLVPAPLFGQASSMWSVALSLSFSIFPPVMGGLVDSYGYPVALRALAGLGFASVATALSAVIVDRCCQRGRGGSRLGKVYETSVYLSGALPVVAPVIDEEATVVGLASGKKELKMRETGEVREAPTVVGTLSRRTGRARSALVPGRRRRSRKGSSTRHLATGPVVPPALRSPSSQAALAIVEDRLVSPEFAQIHAWLGDPGRTPSPTLPPVDYLLSKAVPPAVRAFFKSKEEAVALVAHFAELADVPVDRVTSAALSVQQFHRVLESTGARFDEPIVRALFATFDVDHSGRISVYEFIRGLVMLSRRHGYLDALQLVQTVAEALPEHPPTIWSLSELLHLMADCRRHSPLLSRADMLAVTKTILWMWEKPDVRAGSATVAAGGGGAESDDDEGSASSVLEPAAERTTETAAAVVDALTTWATHGLRALQECQTFLAPRSSVERRNVIMTNSGVERLYKAMIAPVADGGLKLETITRAGISYPSSASGDAIISWIVDRARLRSRDRGRAIGQVLLDRGKLRHVTNDQPMLDDSRILYTTRPFDELDAKFLENIDRETCERIQTELAKASRRGAMLPVARMGINAKSLPTAAAVPAFTGREIVSVIMGMSFLDDLVSSRDDAVWYGRAMVRYNLLFPVASSVAVNDRTRNRARKAATFNDSVTSLFRLGRPVSLTDEGMDALREWHEKLLSAKLPVRTEMRGLRRVRNVVTGQALADVTRLSAAEAAFMLQQMLDEGMLASVDFDMAFRPGNLYWILPPDDVVATGAGVQHAVTAATLFTPAQCARIYEEFRMLAEPVTRQAVRNKRYAMSSTSLSKGGSSVFGMQRATLQRVFAFLDSEGENAVSFSRFLMFVDVLYHGTVAERIALLVRAKPAALPHIPPAELIDSLADGLCSLALSKATAPERALVRKLSRDLVFAIHERVGAEPGPGHVPATEQVLSTVLGAVIYRYTMVSSVLTLLMAPDKRLAVVGEGLYSSLRS
jgi:Ca2+-binding EF-hand superfamily protein/MFS family permease